jgi:predicted transcriptional regulator
MRDEDLQRAALKAVLDQRAAGLFVTGAQMDKSISRMIAEKRRAHAVRN